MLLFVSSVGLYSCIDTRKATYFNNVKDTTYLTSNAYSDWMIQKHDILNITITSLNQQASEVFNLPNGPSATNNSLSEKRQVAGYMVDNDGNIQIADDRQCFSCRHAKKTTSRNNYKNVDRKTIAAGPDCSNSAYEF